MSKNDKTNQEQDIFTNSPDEEDIFANAPDDDSDIFAAVKAIKSIDPEPQKNIQENKQDLEKENIITEEEDIFAEAKSDENEEVEQINIVQNIEPKKINPEPIQQNQSLAAEKTPIEEVKNDEDIFATTNEEEEIAEIKTEEIKPVEIKSSENKSEEKIDDIEIDEEELKAKQAESMKARDIQLDEDLENKIKDIDIENIDDFATPQPAKHDVKTEKTKIEQKQTTEQNLKKNFSDQEESEVKIKQVNFKIQNTQPKIENPKEWLEKLITMIKNPNG